MIQKKIIESNVFSILFYLLSCDDVNLQIYTIQNMGVIPLVKEWGSKYIVPHMNKTLATGLCLIKRIQVRDCIRIMQWPTFSLKQTSFTTTAINQKQNIHIRDK